MLKFVFIVFVFKTLFSINERRERESGERGREGVRGEKEGKGRGNQRQEGYC